MVPIQYSICLASQKYVLLAHVRRSHYLLPSCVLAIMWLVFNIAECSMAKGYVVANTEVTDQDKFNMAPARGPGADRLRRMD